MSKSKIAQLGDQILAAQATLGIPNPEHFQPGLTKEELVSYLNPVGLVHAELFDLYSWRNGVTSDLTIPMGDLWILPDFFVLSAENLLWDNVHYTQEIKAWRSNWYPLLSDGTADRIFVDKEKVYGSKLPVFYAFWESEKPIGQIYDSIETMMETILSCYKKQVYFLDEDIGLNTRFSEEAEISKSLNPHSDYWDKVSREF